MFEPACSAGHAGLLPIILTNSSSSIPPALAVLAGARRLGVEVPGELAVIGVDDIPAAALAAPPLTTLGVDLDSLATYIAESITRKLDGRPAPRRPGSDIHTVVRRESA